MYILLTTQNCYYKELFILPQTNKCYQLNNVNKQFGQTLKNAYVCVKQTKKRLKSNKIKETFNSIKMAFA